MAVKVLNKLERMKVKARLLSLSDETKELVWWYAWIRWESHPITLAKYEYFISYMQNVLSANGLDDSSIFKVTDKNYLGVWFNAQRTINKESLRNMTHDFYTIKKTYNGLTAIED